MTAAAAADTPRAVKRRDLLIGSIALLGSAAVAGGGTAMALSSMVPPPPKPEPSATPETAAAQATPTHGAPAATAASGHGPAPAAPPGLQLAYGSTKVKVTNNGHTFQVNVDKGSSLTVDGKKFELLQFHFHT